MTCILIFSYLFNDYTNICHLFSILFVTDSRLCLFIVYALLIQKMIVVVVEVNFQCLLHPLSHTFVLIRVDKQNGAFPSQH